MYLFRRYGGNRENSAFITISLSVSLSSLRWQCGELRIHFNFSLFISLDFTVAIRENSAFITFFSQYLFVRYCGNKENFTCISIALLLSPWSLRLQLGGLRIDCNFFLSIFSVVTVVIGGTLHSLQFFSNYLLGRGNMENSAFIASSIAIFLVDTVAIGRTPHSLQFYPNYLFIRYSGNKENSAFIVIFFSVSAWSLPWI